MPRLAVLLAFAAALLGACDSAGQVTAEQEAFRLAALAVPGGITETTPDGRVLREDPDDWRTSPLYASRFFFAAAPFPNPLGVGGRLQIGASLSGSGAALVPYRLDGAGSLRLIRGVTGTTEGSAPLFTIPAAELGGPGLHRLVLLDPRGEVVTYGDVRVAAEG